MSVGERDPHTGHMTTGHEWNGIKELNTPVPKPVWFFLVATFTFAVIYWVLMPAWPYGVNYTRGLLGLDQRTIVAENVRSAAIERSVWTDRIAAANLREIQADPRLMQVVREAGHALFGDNCSVCHGTDAGGGPGFPNLAQAPFLWGGDEETVQETIRVGINSEHPETRVSQMLAFGRDQMLARDDVKRVATYVRSLSQPEIASMADKDELAAGAQLFLDNCAACHGENAKGSTDAGAPDLTDRFWVYGGDETTVTASIHGGRMGQMPSWEGRLSDVQRKLLTLYVLDLRTRQQ
ncbi:MAG: cytochrome-c oxidase, cbb3-type subunit III [Devosia sp.]|nr:cytochrome-c oxidase, cbb3-type subunit III [Devosia sp.]